MLQAVLNVFRNLPQANSFFSISDTNPRATRGTWMLRRTASYLSLRFQPPAKSVGLKTISHPTHPPYFWNVGDSLTPGWQQDSLCRGFLTIFCITFIRQPPFKVYVQCTLLIMGALWCHKGRRHPTLVPLNDLNSEKKNETNRSTFWEVRRLAEDTK